MHAGRTLLVAGAAAVAVVGVAEVVHAVAARRGLGPVAGPPDVVLVLGFRGRPDGRPHPLQVWRTELAVANPGVLVFSGGPTTGGASEAATMAALARAAGVPDDRIILEETARTTWENVARSLPHLERGRRIAIVSDPLHALRARGYLARLRPDLAERLVSGGEHRWGDRWWLKPRLLAYELVVRLDDVPTPHAIRHPVASLAMALAARRSRWGRPPDPGGVTP